MKNILVRGGGDLASGVALRLQRAGFHVFISELAQPLAVRRAVSFCEAVFEGQVSIEGQLARRVDSADEAFSIVGKGIIPVLVDPGTALLARGDFDCLVDARLLKTAVPVSLDLAPLVIGLGPGFTCGLNCHAAVETMRGHFLGRVYWQGSTLADTGLPEGDPRRVLRAPVEGALIGFARIGDHLAAGQSVAEINGEKITTPLAGVLRGLIRPGVFVRQGIKIGDIDPRDQRDYCFTVSDKALAIGGGVLEAICARMA